MSGLPHDPKLTKLSRWCLPDPWDTFVAASCSCAMREGGYETGQGQVGCGGDEGSRSVRPMAVATGAMV